MLEPQTSSQPSRESRADRWLKALRNSRVGAAVVVTGVVATALFGFYKAIPDDAKSSAKSWFAKHSKERSVDFCKADAAARNLVKLKGFLRTRGPSDIGAPSSCISILAPIKSPIRGDSASIGFYEKGLSVWTFEKGFFVLSALDASWKPYSETSFCRDDWCADETAGRAHFEQAFGVKIPPGRHPPWAGTARLFEDHPEIFKKLGWYESNCQIGPDKVIYQQFERGAVIGPFPMNGDTSNSQLLVLKNDGGFYAIRIGSYNSDCIVSGY